MSVSIPPLNLNMVTPSDAKSWTTTSTNFSTGDFIHGGNKSSAEPLIFLFAGAGLAWVALKIWGR